MGELAVQELALRFGVAVALGAAIGFEREARNKVAGLRTHALVAVGAALFTMAGAYGFLDRGSGDAFDPARIAAQVASGIGFIGAGAIIRDGMSVHGVTTAATLWTSAAIGLGAGSGFVLGTVVATGVVLLVLLVFRLVSRLLQRTTRNVVELQVTYERGHGTLGPLLHAIEAYGTVERIRIEDEGEIGRPGPRHVSILMTKLGSARVEPLIERIRSDPEIGEAEVRI